MSWYSRCSWCGGPFKGGNCRRCTNFANISTHTPEPSRRFTSFYDDDYEESTDPLNEIVSQISPSIAITPVLPTMEPEDTLIMGNEGLSTILEKESDEVINFSVENLVPIPKGKSMTFSNPLFDSNDDFTSSDDESLSDEDVLEDNNIKNKDSYLNKPDLLVTPLSYANEYECLDPGGDVDKIELLLHHDPSTPKISVVSILEEFTNEPPLEENKDLFDLESKENEKKKILYDAPNNDLMTDDKVFDPIISKKFFSPTYVILPFEDRHSLFFTYVIQIFLPYFTYPVDSPFLLSSGSKDTIFDPDISALELVASHRSGTFISFNVYPDILN
nr:hypothetical protein [Tanacetum cinerariifolium]